MSNKAGDSNDSAGRHADGVGADQGGARRGSRPASSKRSARKAVKKQRPLFLRILIGVITGFAALFLLGVLAFVVLYLVIDIPKANAQAQQAVSVVYYDDGKTEMGRFTTTNREPVQLKQVPLHVQRAFIAAEDRSFYKNRGVSPTGITRAFVNNFSGKGTGSQGGSTLTQQYVKNYFLTQDQTVTRKVKEIVISLKIDQERSKSQILQDYLNNVYFGRGAYGIEAASKSYFHKDVSKLSVTEGAFLASVVNNPENMDPTAGPNSEQRANARMAYTLNGMVTMGWLSQSDRQKATMPTFYKRQPIKYADGPQGYIIQSVRKELSSKLKFSQSDIDRGGLRIKTTINKSRQDAAVKAVEDSIPGPLVGKLHTGLVAEKANDGAVVAMYGGSDYDPVKSPYSDADQAMLQTASTMKLYASIAALQNGKSIDSRYNGNNYLSIGNHQYVQNSGGESFGVIPIRSMLAYSVNTAFVRLNKDIGPQKTLDAAVASGMPKTLGGMNDTNILNVLGTGDSRVVDQATGYNTLNSGGKRYDRYLISKVTTFDDSYSYKVKIQPKQVYDKRIADDLTYALNKTTTYGTAAGTQAQLGRPVAAKTGTASGNKYIWFTGFTPSQLTTSVAMYYTKDGKTTQSMQDLPGVTKEDIYGAGMPRKVWVAFMKAALKGEKTTKLPPRSYWNEDKPSTPEPTSEKTYVPPSKDVQPYPSATQSEVTPRDTETDSPEPSQPTSSDTIPSRSTPAPQPTAPSTSPPRSTSSAPAPSASASGGSPSP